MMVMMIPITNLIITAHHGSDDTVRETGLVNGKPGFSDPKGTKTPELIDLKRDVVIRSGTSLQSCPWVGLTHGLGWFGSRFFSFWWVGLGQLQQKY